MKPHKRLVLLIVVGTSVLFLVVGPVGISIFLNLRQERDEGLLNAARSGERKEVATLLAAGADPNVRDVLEDPSPSLWQHVVEVFTHSHTSHVALARTALSLACENRHAAEIVPLLLDKGANLKEDEVSEQPSLPIAAHRGDVATVRILLQHGADINIRDGLRLSVLQNAVSSDNPELVRLLLDQGAKVEGSFQGPSRTNSKNYETIRQMIENATNGKFAPK